MPSLREPRRIGGIAAALALCACAAGPDYRPPEAPRSNAYSPAPLPQVTAAAPVIQGDPQRIVVGADIRRDWWALLGSSTLDRLIEQAFAASPTIDAADATLRMAQENVAAQRGFFYPTVQAGYALTRAQQSATVPASQTATP